MEATILWRLGERGSAEPDSQDARLEGIERVDAGEVGSDELMSIASLLR